MNTQPMLHTDTSHDAGESHGSLGSYAVGFILSVILTAAAFYMVMGTHLPRGTIVTTIVILAAVQVVVHLICFLHLSTHSDQRWNVTALAFAALVLGILLIGSLWVMRNISEHMTGNDMTPAQARDAPG